MVNNAIYIDGKRAIQPASLDQTYDELRRCPDTGHSSCWIGLPRPSAAEIQSVAEEFNLHPLAVEDAIDAHQRPKLERYGETLSNISTRGQRTAGRPG
jgi:magnesium transporter